MLRWIKALCVLLLLMVGGCSSTDSAGPTTGNRFRVDLSTVGGVWNYQAILLTEHGCWPTGLNAQTCNVNSSLVIIDGSITFGAPDTSLRGAGTWIVPMPATHSLTARYWYNGSGACDDKPISCFTNTSPSTSRSWSGDTIAEIHEGYPDSAYLEVRRIEKVSTGLDIYDTENWWFVIRDSNLVSLADSGHYSGSGPPLTAVHRLWRP